MKSILLSLLIIASANMTCIAQNQQVTIQAGTIVSLESLKEARGAKAYVGESVDFRVTRDVIVNQKLRYRQEHWPRVLYMKPNAQVALVQAGDSE